MRSFWLARFPLFPPFSVFLCDVMIWHSFYIYSLHRGSSEAEACASRKHIECRGFSSFWSFGYALPAAVTLHGLVVMVHCLYALRWLSFIVLYFIPFFRHFLLLLSASSSLSILILNVFAHAISSFFWFSVHCVVIVFSSSLFTHWSLSRTFLYMTFSRLFGVLDYM